MEKKRELGIKKLYKNSENLDIILNDINEIKIETNNGEFTIINKDIIKTIIKEFLSIDKNTKIILIKMNEENYIKFRITGNKKETDIYVDLDNLQIYKEEIENNKILKKIGNEKIKNLWIIKKEKFENDAKMSALNVLNKSKKLIERLNINLQ